VLLAHHTLVVILQCWAVQVETADTDATAMTSILRMHTETSGVLWSTGSSNALDACAHETRIKTLVVVSAAAQADPVYYS